MAKKEKETAPENSSPASEPQGSPKTEGAQTEGEGKTTPPAAPPATAPALPPAKPVARKAEPVAKVYTPIKNLDGTNHIVAQCIGCPSTDTELLEQLNPQDQKRKCKNCGTIFKFHVPAQK